MNIKFSYLYRDAANYKQWHEETFSNAYNFTLDEIEAFIRACLIDGGWFYVNEWNLKDLHVHPWDKTDIVDFLYKIVA